MEALVVSPRVVVPAAALSYRAVRSSGPGGQNVNKVASKIELIIDVSGIEGLSVPQRARLLRKIRSMLNAEGLWVLTSQRTRSQQQNLEDARAKALSTILSALPAPKRRIETQPSRAARQRRLTDKRRTSEKKRTRRWKSDD